MNRDRILQTAQQAQPDREPVDVPAWGGTAYITPLTLGDIRKAGREAEARGLSEMSVYIARSAQTESGARIFEDQDAQAIDRMNLRTIRPITEAINKVNGFDETDEDTAGK